MLAVLRSSLEHLTGKSWSWSALVEPTGFQTNRVAWTVQSWTKLAEQGFDIHMIENFNYHLYSRQGEQYLKTVFSKEQLSWQLKNTNILTIQPLLPSFFKLVSHEQRSPNLSDIDFLLKKGYLVFVTLNACTLNNKPGYTDHAILVFDRNGQNYIAHNPGLPPIKNRVIEPDLLYQAMGGKNNTSEVTGLRSA